MAHAPRTKETRHLVVDIPAEEEISVEEDDGISKEVSQEKDDEEMTSDEEYVEVEELQTLLKKKLDEVPGEPFEIRPVTIFRLPTWLHVTSKELCEPKIVSIGPYHRGKESYQAMEKHKVSTLRDFLARNNNVGLDVYLRKMKALEAQARQCYSETVDLASDDFVTMLLLDGCFILEWFLKSKHRQVDAICHVGWAEDVFGDLLLIENQVPFFVIKKLFDVNGGKRHKCEGDCPLQKLFELTFALAVTEFRPPQISCNNIHHLLHLYYKTIVPDVPSIEQRNLVRSKLCSWRPRVLGWPNVAPERMGISMPCVSELHEAGVKFKKKTHPSHICDISFMNGIMEIPTLNMDTTNKVWLWNMVAFEQSQIYTIKQTLSSYIALMDSLINTEKDVAILERCGIMDSLLQNDEDAAAFFNQTGMFITLSHDKHYFHDLFQKVKKYNGSTWHRHRARLMHDYFSNPWALISVMAAGILLVLSFMQTYYSAK